MTTYMRKAKPMLLPKIGFFLILLALSVNACEARVAVGVGLNFGAPAYAPAPVYYGPPPRGYYGPAPEYYEEPIEDVEWVPRHFEDGYWVPGRYVEYVINPPGPDFMWVKGHWDNYHHWHHGYWHQY